MPEITIQPTEKQQIVQREEEFVTGYKDGLKLYTPPYRKETLTYWLGYQSGSSDRKLIHSQISDNQLYWSESSMTSEY